MKTFEDLVFTDHPFYVRAQQAILWFDNGYGVSVLCGARFYSNGRDTYEVAVMYDDQLTYPMEDDVVGHLTADKVTAYMDKVQSLWPDKKEYVYPGSDVQQ